MEEATNFDLVSCKGQPPAPQDIHQIKLNTYHLNMPEDLKCIGGRKCL